VHFGAKPYRELMPSMPNKIEFMNIGVQQNKTLLIVGAMAFAFAALNLGFLLFARFKEKQSANHFPAESSGEPRPTG
jgi:hypothetical protein